MRCTNDEAAVRTVSTARSNRPDVTSNLILNIHNSYCCLNIPTKTITKNYAFIYLQHYYIALLLLVLNCVVCNCCLAVCIVVVVLCVLLSSYVYLLHYLCIAVCTLDAGMLARSQ